MPPAEIPLFPLDTVLVPGGFLPLRIFEPRYLDMVRDCASQGTGFGVCLLLSGGGDKSPPRHARIGTEARIRDFYTLDDGLLGISAEGHGRFRVSHTRYRDNGLLIGEVDWMAEPSPRSIPEQYEILSRIAERFMEEIGKNYPDFEPAHLQDAAWVGYRLTELLPLGNEEKQALLELSDPSERLQHLLEAIPRFQSDPPNAG